MSLFQIWLKVLEVFKANDERRLKGQKKAVEQDHSHGAIMQPSQQDSIEAKSVDFELMDVFVREDQTKPEIFNAIGLLDHVRYLNFP